MTLRKGEERWKLKEDALYRILWRTRFGRGCGRVIRQTTKLIKLMNVNET